MNSLKFSPENTDFYKELKTRIDHYFVSNNISTKANQKMLSKLIIMGLIYSLSYASIYMFGGNLLHLFIIYGFIGSWSVLLGLNMGHDAAHNAIFTKNKHNKYLLLIFELLGTSSYNWKNRHLGAHHVFPNVMDYDSDIQQSNIVKIFPEDKPTKIHFFQHLYMPFIYMFYIIRWLIYRDFKDVLSSNIGVFDNSNYPQREVYKMILSKLFYFFYLVILPSYFLELSFLTVSLAFFFLTICGSLTITLALLSTHVGENANFPAPDKNGVLPYSWSYHQVMTASDFGTENKLINLLFGGFNHHVIHHLFPHICHAHYPQLTPILKETCQKYNLPYRSEKHLAMAIISHFKLLKQNGRR